MVSRLASIVVALATLGSLGLSAFAVCSDWCGSDDKVCIEAIGPQDDDDEAEFRRFEAKRTFRENCLICHSEEMVTAQRLTPQQWKAEVEKMIGWGAPVPNENVATLTEFLIKEYSSDRPRPPIVRQAIPISPEAAKPDGAPSGDAGRGVQLFATHCLNCHGNDAQGAELGPNLVEKTILIRTDEFEQVVLNGRNRMPGYGAVLKPQEAADILAWLRGKRYSTESRP